MFCSVKKKQVYTSHLCNVLAISYAILHEPVDVQNVIVSQMGLNSGNIHVFSKTFIYHMIIPHKKYKQSSIHNEL